MKTFGISVSERNLLILIEAISQLDAKERSMLASKEFVSYLFAAKYRLKPIPYLLGNKVCLESLDRLIINCDKGIFSFETDTCWRLVVVFSYYKTKLFKSFS